MATLNISILGERFENKVKIDFSNPFEDKSYFNIFGFGSINGTVCLYQASHANKLVLWNPTTKEYKLIPPSPFELSSVENAVKYRNKDVCFDLQGFGYDHVTDDYKVIPWGMVLQQNHDNEWVIYSLKNNSWRKLDIDVDLDVTHPWRFDEGTQVYLDGVCHWLCRVHYDPLPSQPIHYDSLPRHIVHIPCLVSFSLSDAVLFTTPTPLDLDDWFDDGMWCLILAVLNGSITLISYHVKMATLNISILGEFGMKESWIKLFTVAPLPCVERPIGVGTKGEIIFLRKDGELAWLDLSTHMIGEFGIKVPSCGCHLVIYKESILPIGEINN